MVDAPFTVTILSDWVARSSRDVTPCHMSSKALASCLENVNTNDRGTLRAWCLVFFGGGLRKWGTSLRRILMVGFVLGWLLEDEGGGRDWRDEWEYPNESTKDSSSSSSCVDKIGRGALRALTLAG